MTKVEIIKLDFFIVRVIYVYNLNLQYAQTIFTKSQAFLKWTLMVYSYGFMLGSWGVLELFDSAQCCTSVPSFCV